MVLVHKLKQMEGIDIEQFRDTEASIEPDEQADCLVEKASTAQRIKRNASPPRRPLTRSQTGRVSKRKRRDDTPVETKPRNSTVRVKKPKVSPPPPVELPVTAPVEKPTPPLSPRHDTSESSVSVDVLPLNATQLTFLDTTSPSVIPLDRRIPRSRAVLPVPVPNLTKKSRGRRVPTKIGTDKEAPKQETRLYVCQVEGCGKCFHRGEHLKRHIRSIHTYEKPFKCTQPRCEKYFNRHDNLLQHLKVHKSPFETTASQSHSEEETGSLPPHQVTRTESPIIETLAIPMHKPERPIYQPPASYIGYSTTTPYGSSLSANGFSTNLAVSSLRTEMPHSPPVLRTRINQNPMALTQRAHENMSN